MPSTTGPPVVTCSHRGCKSDASCRWEPRPESDPRWTHLSPQVRGRGDLTQTDAARAAEARARTRARNPSEEPPTCDTADAVIAAWTGWLSPVPWALQLHANCREPLGAGSWAHFLALARRLLEHLGAMPIVAFGCTQPNKDRDRLHLHALLAPAWPAPVNARDVLLELPRWNGPHPLGKYLEERLGQLHAVSRPYDFRLGDGASTRPAAVRLLPVTPRGKTTDHTSLVHYIVRYLLRFDAGDWLEEGNLAPYVTATSVPYHTPPPFTNANIRAAIARDNAARASLGLCQQ